MMSTMTHTKHRKRRERFGAIEMTKLHPALIEGRMARASVPLWGDITNQRQTFLREVFGGDAARYAAWQTRPEDIPWGLEHRRIDSATAEQVREYIDTSTYPLGLHTPPDGRASSNLLQLDNGTAVFIAPLGTTPHERNY